MQTFPVEYGSSQTVVFLCSRAKGWDNFFKLENLRRWAINWGREDERPSRCLAGTE